VRSGPVCTNMLLPDHHCVFLPCLTCTGRHRRSPCLRVEMPQQLGVGLMLPHYGPRAARTVCVCVCVCCPPSHPRRPHRQHLLLL
jgi:hypothetical protein